ncbi:hypothetical protein OG709_21615 [Streptomyces sp. NBC_01267]|uniref:hypothetical protein n=1 Tax=unclassified Streptomyces TaxID=2593676 RepID=UPI002E351C74|nr:hypothetical protein [Streptomyces sp. NBC_01267]
MSEPLLSPRLTSQARLQPRVQAQPQFQAQAQPQQRLLTDGNSLLKDPVVTVRQLSRFPYLTRRPSLHSDHALVFFTAKGDCEIFMPPRRPRLSDVVGKRYVAVYEVDVSLHPVSLPVPLPSAIDAFSFESIAHLTWQVVDPARVITTGVRDVPALLGPRLGGILREASRRHRTDAVPDAERAVQQAFDTAPPIAAAEGLRVGCTVRLSADDGERAQSRRLRAARHEAAASSPEHRVRLEQLRRELEEQDYRQRITAERISFYRSHLSEGSSAALVLHLVEHPEDTALVVKNMREDQSELVRNQLELMNRILTEHGLESYQMEKPKDYVVETMNRLLAQPSPAQPQQDAKLFLPAPDTGTGTENMARP